MAVKIADADLEIIVTSLKEALYHEKSIPDLALHFAISLTNSGNPNNTFISKLSAEMRQSAKFRHLLRSAEPNVIEEVGTEICSILQRDFPDIEYSIEGREKSLFSDINKRISKLLESNSAQIQDLFALRIIMLNEDNEAKNIMVCYEVLNSLLAHFSLYSDTVQRTLSWDISVKEVSPLKNHRAHVAQKFPNLYLPEFTGVNPIFKSLVKDYIFYPNPDGYQSVHIILIYRGIPIEIQIRTVNMHHWAEYGPAKHQEYKKKRIFQGISLEIFDENLIACPKYEHFDKELITYPGTVNAIPFFRYSPEKSHPAE